MNESEIACPSCGVPVKANVKFCGACGAAIQLAEAQPPDETRQLPAEPDAGPGPVGKASTSGTKESASEFAEVLKDYAALPGVRLAGFASLIGIGVVLIFGFLIAILLPDSSGLSYGDDDSLSLFKEVMFQVAGTSLGGIELSGEGDSLGFHPTPILFFLVPVLGVALGVVQQLRSGVQLDRRSAIIAAASAGIPFAVVMSIAALLASDGQEEFGINASVSSTFLLSLVAGGIGGLAGALFVQREDDPSSVWPKQAKPYASLAWALLKPLGILLIAVSLFGAVIWSIQSIRDVAEVRGERSMVTSVVDSVAFSGDLGIRNVGLGTLSTFELSGFNESTGVPIPVDPTGEKITELTDEGKFNLLDYKNVLNAWAFVPILIVLILLPLILALYSGFLIGRERKDSDPKLGAAWGALVGPVWAVALVVLNALSVDLAFGHLIGDSFFVMVLIGGAILGAVGGLLGNQNPGPAGSDKEATNG